MHLLHRHQLPDKPRGAHSDLGRIKTERKSGIFRHLLRIGHSLSTIAGISIAGVKDHCLDLVGLTVFQGSLGNFTGAATTRLRVNTAAASKLGPWLTTRAISGLPEGLMPAMVDAARKPGGTVTPTGWDSDVVMACILLSVRGVLCDCGLWQASGFVQT